MSEVFVGVDMASGPSWTTIHCPACRMRKRAGVMYARVGAQLLPFDDAPKDISHDLVCMTCGFECRGPNANPLPVVVTEPAS